MNKKLLFILILTASLLSQVNAYSINRWLKFTPGIRISGTAVDIDSRVPDNGTSTRLDFGGGATLDIQFEKHFGIEIGLLYARKGSESGTNGRRIFLHYISIPMVSKLWIVRNRFAAILGITHNILLGVDGRLSSPNVELTLDNTNRYDFGLTLGLSYVIVHMGKGIHLVGDFRVEIGMINVYNRFRPELFNRVIPYLSFGITF